MGPARRPSHLSGSQSSLASETGMGSADPQLGTPSSPDPKGPSEYQAIPSNLPASPSSASSCSSSFLTQSTQTGEC